MTVNTGAFLHNTYNIAQSIGTDATNSDATLVIIGRENLHVKIKSFPDPTSLPAEPIVVPLPLGNETNKPGQAKTSFSGSASFVETEDRVIERTFTEIKFETGGYFDAWLYHGTPDKFVNRKKLRNCFFAMGAPVQRDFQSNTEILLLEGDITGNYFGEIEEGNVKTLMGGF